MEQPGQPVVNINPQPQANQGQQGLNYLIQLVNEYLKTMPPPVEQPVKQVANRSAQAVAQDLEDYAKLQQMVVELQAKIEERKAMDAAANSAPKAKGK